MQDWFPANRIGEGEWAKPYRLFRQNGCIMPISAKLSSQMRISLPHSPLPNRKTMRILTLILPSSPDSHASFLRTGVFGKGVFGKERQISDGRPDLFYPRSR
ncbi:MAG: hypothetical protein ACLPID_01345 [Beijerinckiaceae bacterium]